MSRPLRIHVHGAVYHVTLRGNHRQDIFFGPDDRDRLSELIAEAIDRFGARLHAYCYMSNHIHALLQVADVPLGRLMLRIAGRYARDTQKSLQTTGHLFEKRYYPVLVDADNYLLQVLRYVHLNPVRARLVKSPDDYPWSSHHVYVGSRHEPWVTTDFALSMFHGERNQAVNAYRAFTQEGVSAGAPSPFAQLNPGDQRILGNDAFVTRVCGKGWQPRAAGKLEDLVSEACEHFMVTPAGLLSASRSPTLVKARAWIGHQAITTGTASLTAVARSLNRDESSLRHSVKRYFGYP